MITRRTRMQLLVFAVIVGGTWFIGSLLMVLAGLLWT